jgi:prolyl 4-hydroxylase
MPAAMSAQLMLAQQYEREGRREEALALFRAAADAGDAQGQLALGVRQLGGSLEDRARGLQLIGKAVDQNHPGALHLWSVMAAAGFGQRQDWGAAMRLLARAADHGHARAQAQIALLGDPEQFDLTRWLSPAVAQMKCASPRIGAIDDFLPQPVCDWLITVARPGLKHAQVLDADSGARAYSGRRTNTGAYLGLLQSDIIVRLVKARIAAALGKPVSQQEDSNILHYSPGELFAEHYDFQDPNEPGHARELAAVGQRIATFLVYLNEDYEGGETAFPLLNWSYKGKKGDALFFWNVSHEGEVERQLLHAGLAPTRGEKWLFSQWVRDRPIEGADLPAIG